MQKSLWVTVAGPSNSGKSTMVNAIIGEQVSIVTHKPQTTRANIKGIYTSGDVQIVFTDTPGLFSPKTYRDSVMIKRAMHSVSESDITVVVIDHRPVGVEYFHDIKSENKICVINKSDRMTKSFIAKLKQRINAKKIFVVSATSGTGIREFLSYIKKIAVCSPWLYDEEHITDIDNEYAAQEIVRKHILLHIRNEIPYLIDVKIETWDENDKRIMTHQTISVQKSAHKKIIPGKGGEMIKSIGQCAREEMISRFAKEVHLFLHLKEDFDELHAEEFIR